MINCLQTRDGIIHYVSWITTRGIHYTMCGKAYTKKRDKINTYEIDSDVPGSCKNCAFAMSNIHNDDKRTFRGKLLETNRSIYRDIQREFSTPKELYGGLLDGRTWFKLTRMKIKVRAK